MNNDFSVIHQTHYEKGAVSKRSVGDHLEIIKISLNNQNPQYPSRALDLSAAQVV
jgi:hypothetical protein